MIANAGTTLMLVSSFHLLLGNLVIGLIETAILTRRYREITGRISIMMVLANYTSAWLGGISVMAPLTAVPDITIENLKPWLAVFAILSFLVTLAIEYPFVWYSLQPNERERGRILRATLLVNGVTYPMLAAIFWLSSGTSLMTKLQVVESAEILPETQYAVFYLSPDGKKLLKRKLIPGAPVETIAQTNAPHSNDRLSATENAQGKYDLVLYHEDSTSGSLSEETILPSFSSRAGIDGRIPEGYPTNPRGTWLAIGPAASLAENSQWEIRTGFYAAEGISAENPSTRRKITYSLETPFRQWIARNATHLEGDYIVFQLGWDQICILHLETKKIALLARGKGPVVAELENRTD